MDYIERIKSAKNIQELKTYISEALSGEEYSGFDESCLDWDSEVIFNLINQSLLNDDYYAASVLVACAEMKFLLTPPSEA